MLAEVSDLRGGYGGPDICRGINLTVDGGEILSVVGPNGCGKTTLFRLLLGFLKPTGGSILMDGSSILRIDKKLLAKLVAYIPQHHQPIFSYTALEIVMMGRASHFPAFSSPRPADRDAAFAALESLRVEHLANKRFAALSGGQRQLILIARAICQNARLFIMDEPGASLDYANHQLLMDVTVSLAERGYGIIQSTHSPEHPFSIAHKVLLMRDGQSAAFGPPAEAITPQVLEQIYGIPMDVVTVVDRGGTKRTLCLPVK